MNGFLIFITLVVSFASSLGYQYPLPGIHSVGEEIVITADAGCPWRDIEPVETIAHTVRQIDYHKTSVIFDEPGIVTGLRIFCVHSIYEQAPDIVPVDWMIR